MRSSKEQIDVAAPTNGWVLITGENGTGKELVARQIHVRSRRADGAVRRGELRGDPRGADRERAVRPREGRVHRRDRSRSAASSSWPHGGTLFLDEIGDMSLTTQAKILRILQEQQLRARRRHRDDRGRRARDRGDQQGPRGGDRRGPLPRGPLLPPERDPVPRAAAARAREDIPCCRALPGEFAPSRARPRHHAARAAKLRATPGRATCASCEPDRAPGADDAGEDRRADLPARSRRSGRWRRPAGDTLARRARVRARVCSRGSRDGWNISRTAEAVGLARESLSRKLRALDIDAERRVRALSRAGAPAERGPARLARATLPKPGPARSRGARARARAVAARRGSCSAARGDEAEILTLAVARGRRRRGVGRALLAALLAPRAGVRACTRGARLERRRAGALRGLGFAASAGDALLPRRRGRARCWGLAVSARTRRCARERVAAACSRCPTGRPAPGQFVMLSPGARAAPRAIRCCRAHGGVPRATRAATSSRSCFKVHGPRHRAAGRARARRAVSVVGPLGSGFPPPRRRARDAGRRRHRHRVALRARGARAREPAVRVLLGARTRARPDGLERLRGARRRARGRDRGRHRSASAGS